MSLSKLSDEELLRLTAAGDENAFTTLYRRRQGAIYRFALQMSGCPAVAEDVTQEVFIRMICDPHNYNESRGTVAAYLYGIARNQVLRRLRREQNHMQIDDEETAVVPESLIAASDPLGDLTRSEAIESLRQAVLALPEHYREAVILCDLHEMSYQESASALGCSVGTIRSRLHRGRALLAEKLRSSRAASRAMDEKRCLTWNAETLKA